MTLHRTSTDAPATEQATSATYATHREALAKLGRLFGASRVDAGLTQAEVADRVNRSRCSVANFEAGRQDTPISVVLAMAQAVGLRVTFEPVYHRGRTSGAA